MAFLSRKFVNTALLLQKFINTRLSIAFKDLLNSSIAPHIKPHWLEQVHKLLLSVALFGLWKEDFFLQFCAWTHSEEFSYFWSWRCCNILCFDRKAWGRTRVRGWFIGMGEEYIRTFVFLLPRIKLTDHIIFIPFFNINLINKNYFDTFFLFSWWYSCYS